jgi:polar amino acid transport system permease protein
VRRKKIKITLLDIVMICLILGAAAYIVYRLTMALNYNWKWSIIPQYLVRYDEEQGAWVVNFLLQGLLTTLRLSFWATILAMIMGTILGVMRTTRRLFNRLVSRTYVELIRNMPPLVLVFIFYFFIGDQILPILGVDDFVRGRSEQTQDVLAWFFAPPAQFTAFLSGVITVALFQGAYITEIIRAGLQSVEKGLWEASYALGLSWRQQMQHVIFPVAFKRILPPLANEFINTIKYSSIVSVISIQELTFQGFQIMASTHVTIEVWLTVTAMYLLLCLILSMGVQRLEVHLARSEK